MLSMIRTTKTTTQCSVSEHWWSIWRRTSCAVVNSPSQEDVEDLLGSFQSCSKEGAREAQVHFLSSRTSLVCPIATAQNVSGFGHVAEMVLISNALSFSQNLVA